MAIVNTETGRISHMHSFKQEREESANQGSDLSNTSRGQKGREQRSEQRSLPGGRVFGCVSPDAWKPTCLYGAAGQLGSDKVLIEAHKWAPLRGCESQRGNAYLGQLDAPR